MDVFVQPSLTEGLSNAVLEAMATGLPVVATQVGGNPEVVEDGVSGRLVPADDAAAMCQALASYCSDTAARIRHGAAGRARVQRSYSIGTMVAQYSTLYHSLL